MANTMFDFLQCIENNAHVSFQIGNDLCHVLSIGDNFDALIVRIVSNRERSFYRLREVPKITSEPLKQIETFVASLPHLFFRFDETSGNEVLILIGRDQTRCSADILRIEGQLLRLVTQSVLQFSTGGKQTGAVRTQTFVLTAKTEFDCEEVTLEYQPEKVLLGTLIVSSAISRISWTLYQVGRTQMRTSPLPLPSDWYHPPMHR